MLEQLRVAEEVGHLDQEASGELPVLLRMAVEVAQVVLERVDAGLQHAASEPPLEGWLPIAGEVDPAGVAELLEQQPHPPILVDRLGRVASGQQVVQERTDRF